MRGGGEKEEEKGGKKKRDRKGLGNKGREGRRDGYMDGWRV